MLPRPADRPRDPPDGDSWSIPTTVAPAGTYLFRVSLARYANPAHYGRQGRHRFDAPDKTFGVCYLGTTLECCLLEVFGAAIRHDGLRRVLTPGQLGEYGVAIVKVLQPLRLAHLADNGLGILGIDLRVTGGDDYALSQRWAAAIHSHSAAVDGILYSSRHHNRLYSVALFERASSSVELESWGRLGDYHCTDLWIVTTDFLRHFEIELVDDADDSTAS